MAAIDAARADLAAVPLPVQLGGPVGTLAAYGDRGPAVTVALADELGLAVTPLPWHTDRSRLARPASALGTLAGVVAKPARDVTLLAQGEVGEVREAGDGDGGSPTTAHRRTPVASVLALACAARTPGLVATILGAMAQEHERGAGGWQAEWETLSDLLRLTGAAVAWARDLLEHLEVDATRMRANLNALLEDPDAHAVAVGKHVAAAAALVDRALAAHRALEDA
jgi:3-carboxy-cis,cis-muconate cycloisomerase